MATISREQPARFNRGRIATVAVVAILAVVGIVALGGVLLQRHLNASTRTTDVVSVVRDAEVAVPRGSTTTEIHAYLRARGYDTGPSYAARAESFLEDSGVPPDAEVIRAVIPDVVSGTLVDGDIYLYFILDTDRTLDRILAQEFLTGP